jgi:luciferase-type oxidoreductase
VKVNASENYHTSSKQQLFPDLNNGFNSVFKVGKLTVGLVVPIENYPTSSVPSMHQQLEKIQLAEALGFNAVWLRDVPFNVPSFGDAGQLFDPFVYLGLLAGQTTKIALGVASLILPLRHPAHVAKAAASADAISGGRLILGVASGDRFEEYPAMGVNYQERGRLFRESYEYIRQATDSYPRLRNAFGELNGQLDLLPKPQAERLPMLITGASQQSNDWLASNGDGWITYPRAQALQAQFIRQLRQDNRKHTQSKPVMEPLYIDITANPDSPPQPIHLGYRLGINHLSQYLLSRQEIGVNHVALNLRFNQSDVEKTLKDIATYVLPSFNNQD